MTLSRTGSRAAARVLPIPKGYRLHEDPDMVLVTPQVTPEMASILPPGVSDTALYSRATSLAFMEVLPGARLTPVYIHRRRLEELARAGVRRAIVALILDAHTRGLPLPACVQVQISPRAQEAKPRGAKILSSSTKGMLPMMTESARVPEKKSAFEKLEDACYDLVTQAYGRGAAISIDKEGQGFVARAWRPSGSLGALAEPQKTKASALRALKKKLGK